MANGHSGTAQLDVHDGKPGGPLRYIPAFLYIMILYIVGKFLIHDPRAALVSVGDYHLSWVEILLLASAVVAMVEQMKVSHPGIDNTLEALGMVAMGVVQLICFVLGAAKIVFFTSFSTTEFLMITFISLMAAVVAVLINARTLRRTIGVGDS